MDNLYTCTPRQVREYTLDAISAGLVPFIKSSPGMGKSSIVRSIAEEVNCHLTDHRLSTSAPEDLTGLPEFYDKIIETNEGPVNVGRRARFVPFGDIFPIAGEPLPAGKDGHIIFFDEANSAAKAVQAASYKVTLDKMIGQYKLHPYTALIMAGNLASDRAIVNALSTAMQSRVVHLDMVLSFDEWFEDVAIAEDYDNRIKAYLNYRKGHLMDFQPDHNENTFCCPRTWEFMNKLIKGKQVLDSKIPLYAGTITSAGAVEFVQFTKTTNVPSLADILRDPMGCKVPHDSAGKWFVMSHLMDGIDDTNAHEISQYVGRLGLDMQIVFFRSALVSKPQLRRHPAFAKAMIELQQYLNPPKPLAA
jgi:hypothetical protein